jgi:hypothetical protein
MSSVAPYIPDRSTVTKITSSIASVLFSSSTSTIPPTPPPPVTSTPPPPVDEKKTAPPPPAPTAPPPPAEEKNPAPAAQTTSSNEEVTEPDIIDAPPPPPRKKRLDEVICEFFIIIKNGIIIMFKWLFGKHKKVAPKECKPSSTASPSSPGSPASPAPPPITDTKKLFKTHVDSVTGTEVKGFPLETYYKDRIAYIVKTLGSNMIEAAEMSGVSRDAGKEIDSVHPLIFLWFILTVDKHEIGKESPPGGDSVNCGTILILESLKKLYKKREKTFEKKFFWDSFLFGEKGENGIVQKIEKSEIAPHLDKFARETNVHPKHLQGLTKDRAQIEKVLTNLIAYRTGNLSLHPYPKTTTPGPSKEAAPPATSSDETKAANSSKDKPPATDSSKETTPSSESNTVKPLAEILNFVAKEMTTFESLAGPMRYDPKGNNLLDEHWKQLGEFPPLTILEALITDATNKELMKTISSMSLTHSGKKNYFVTRLIKTLDHPKHADDDLDAPFQSFSKHLENHERIKPLVLERKWQAVLNTLLPNTINDSLSDYIGG